MTSSLRLPALLGSLCACVATLSVFSAPAFAAEICLVAPNGGDIFIRDRSGHREGESWRSRTLDTVDDEAMTSGSGFAFVQTAAGKSGYVSKVVLQEAAQCEDAGSPKDGDTGDGRGDHGDGEGNAKKGGASRGRGQSAQPKPRSVDDGKVSPLSGDPFGCGSGQGASQCNRTALQSESLNGKHCGSYSQARVNVFLSVDTLTDDQGQRYVQSPYSNDTLVLNGDHMPDASTFNIEHTWPQSKLKQYPNFETTRADMHHLFAIESKINGQRGNLPFCDVAGEPAGQGRISELGDGCFEPPEQHKGIVARAMFYMATTYGMSIDSDQEKTLRLWNHQYPVTQWEQERSHEVSVIQGNVNPFVEHPEYADLMNDF